MMFVIKNYFSDPKTDGWEMICKKETTSLTENVALSLIDTVTYQLECKKYTCVITMVLLAGFCEIFFE